MIVRPMLAYARTRGVDVDAMLRELGLDPRVLEEYDARVPEEAWLRAWELAAERTGDDAFGVHVAEETTLGAFDVLDYAIYFSSVLRDAIDEIIRFHRLLADTWDMELVEVGGTHRLRRLSRTTRAEQEAGFAVLVRRVHELTGSDASPREVRFTHPAPTSASRKVLDDFFRCRVRFDCAWTEIVLHREALDLPIRSANTNVVRILERYMRDLLARLPAKNSFVDHARTIVSRGLLVGQRPTLDAVARAMHASRRTVQRRLRAHETSYGDVVDDARREIADRLMHDERLSITEITFILGFDDVSGFRRAFKRWTGVAPSHRRRELDARH